MNTRTTELATGPQLQSQRQFLYIAALLLIIIGALVVYKSTAALAVIEKVHVTRTFQPRTDAGPLPGNLTLVNTVARSVNYFAAVWPALLFGVLISGAVRVLDPPGWLSRALTRGPIRSQLFAGLAGASLMLCSCCVAPVFCGIYERSSRLAPSLAVMLAAPSLNPATLILTLLLFGSRIAIMRLAVASVLVFCTGILIERLCDVRAIACQTENKQTISSTLIAFGRSCLHVGLRTLPLIAIGVFVSMALALWVPFGTFSSGGAQILTIMAVAIIAVPLAMPTFFEIPLALLLVSIGAPAEAAFAMLIAGPAINLPSLFAIARSANWKVAAAVAVTVLVLSVLGGLLVGLT